MNCAGLIVEGVTGAGKTKTLEALRTRPDFRAWLDGATFIDEDAILGSVMDQFKDSSLDARTKWAPLLNRLSRIESQPGRYLAERFHPTFFALVPERALFDTVDQRLAALGFRVVLLHYDETEIPVRGLDRVDRRGTDWKEDMVGFHGGEQKTIEAIAESQRRRFECIAASQLPSLKVNTTFMKWADYAGRIAVFMSQDEE